MSKLKLATVWLDGCSGCHMSLLDLDEGILTVAQQADLVYSPLVEGAVSSQEDLSKLQTIRARTRLLVSLGDCAVTANVPAMRNTIPVQKLLQFIYVAGADVHPAVPTQGVPALLPQARPLHDYVKVDYYLPGCPPRPDAILALLSALLEGRAPKMPAVKFG